MHRVPQLLLCALLSAGCLELPSTLPEASSASVDTGTDVGDTSRDSPDTSPDEGCTPPTLASEGWMYVEAGLNHACALWTDGRMYCWGENLNGEFDPNGPRDLLLPLRVAAGHSFKSLTAGEHHTCGLDGDNRMWCWGNNEFGHIRPEAADEGVLGVTEVLANETILSSDGHGVIDADRTHTCVLTGTNDDASAICWGEDDASLGPTPGEPIPLGDVGDTPSLDVGDDVSCVVTQNPGQVQCWGKANDVMRYTGCEDRCPTPREALPHIDSPSTLLVRGLSVADNHGCFIRADDADDVWCWGDNSDDRVWPEQPHPSPAYDTRVPARDVATGITHTCAATCGGDVLCWGDGNESQLGPEEDGFGRVIVDGEAFIQVTAGGRFTCGITQNRRLFCWGLNSKNQLGVEGGDSQIPLEVARP